MEATKLLEYIRVPALLGNPFVPLNKKVDRVIANVRSGNISGGIVVRLGDSVDRLNRLKYTLMSNTVSEDELKKAAEEVESLMAAINRDADLLLTL